MRALPLLLLAVACTRQTQSDKVVSNKPAVALTPPATPPTAGALLAWPVAPFTKDEGVQRNTFRALRTIRDALQKEALWVPALSMGMSADYGVAVEEGATMLRLGTALFGPRPA